MLCGSGSPLWEVKGAIPIPLSRTLRFARRPPRLASRAFSQLAPRGHSPQVGPWRGPVRSAAAVLWGPLTQGPEPWVPARRFAPWSRTVVLEPNFLSLSSGFSHAAAPRRTKFFRDKHSWVLIDRSRFLWGVHLSSLYLPLAARETRLRSPCYWVRSWWLTHTCLLFII